MKNEILKSLISGIVNGIIVAILLLWGVRSAFYEVAIEKKLIEKEYRMLEIKHASVIEQNIEFRQSHTDLKQNYSILLNDYRLLQEKLQKYENPNNGSSGLRQVDNSTEAKR